MNIALTVIYEPAPEGGFGARIAEIPGAISQGETREEAAMNVMNALDELLKWKREETMGEEVKNGPIQFADVLLEGRLQSGEGVE